MQNAEYALSESSRNSHPSILNNEVPVIRCDTTVPDSIGVSECPALRLFAPLLQYASLRNFHALHKSPVQPFHRVLGHHVMSEQA